MGRMYSSRTLRRLPARERRRSMTCGADAWVGGTLAACGLAAGEQALPGAPVQGAAQAGVADPAGPPCLVAQLSNLGHIVQVSYVDTLPRLPVLVRHLRCKPGNRQSGAAFRQGQAGLGTQADSWVLGRLRRRSALMGAGRGQRGPFTSGERCRIAAANWKAYSSCWAHSLPYAAHPEQSAHAAHPASRSKRLAAAAAAAEATAPPAAGFAGPPAGLVARCCWRRQGCYL